VRPLPVDLYNEMLDELERRGCAYWDIYPRIYNCSIGAHMFNVHSLERQVLYVAGLPYDTRIHVFLVTFPGFGKSFWLFQYLLSDVGLIGQTNIPTTFEGYMTEAGWVGTARFGPEGTMVQRPGIAQEYNIGIAGCEEFAALSNAIQQTYNRQFDTALLTSLDQGFVNKRLAAGPIKYKTSITLWTGTQPARFDLAGGMGRRLTFMHYIPTDEDIERMRKIRRTGFGKRLNIARTERIRKLTNQRKVDIALIRDVWVDDSVYKYLDKFKMMHYEEPLYERLLLGYWVMRGEFDKQLVLKMDDGAKWLIDQEYKWRLEIKKGSEYSQILEYVRSQQEMEISRDNLRLHMLNLGYDAQRAKDVIDRLKRLRGLLEKDGLIYIPRRRRDVEKESSS